MDRGERITIIIRERKTESGEQIWHRHKERDVLEREWGNENVSSFFFYFSVQANISGKKINVEEGRKRKRERERGGERAIETGTAKSF